jgi:SEC-C motif-containing protein
MLHRGRHYRTIGTIGTIGNGRVRLGAAECFDRPSVASRRRVGHAVAMDQPTPCPCDAARRYAACCGRWHTGLQHLQAPTAEALMRSRYSAFVLGLTDYLADTWHPSTRPVAPITLTPGVRWLGLDVRSHAALDAEHARVEFLARSKYGGRASRLHETSRFVREAGRWYYLDGDVR